MTLPTRNSVDERRLREKLYVAEQDVSNLIRILSGDKFKGVDQHGERKDWVSTGDMLTWLIDLRSKLHVEAN